MDDINQVPWKCNKLDVGVYEIRDIRSFGPIMT